MTIRCSTSLRNINELREQHKYNEAVLLHNSVEYWLSFFNTCFDLLYRVGDSDFDGTKIYRIQSKPFYNNELVCLHEFANF